MPWNATSVRTNGTQTADRAPFDKCYAALMEGALQLAVSDRLPCTRAGFNPRSGTGGYRDAPVGRRLSCEVV